jgi:hypothetical protein
MHAGRHDFAYMMSDLGSLPAHVMDVLGRVSAVLMVAGREDVAGVLDQLRSHTARVVGSVDGVNHGRQRVESNARAAPRQAEWHAERSQPRISGAGLSAWAR